MMKKITILAFSLFALVSCENNSKAEEFPDPYLAVGEDFPADNILTATEMHERFKNLEEGDTIDVKFKSDVNAVCKNKGCWMRVDMPVGEEALVKFKDYAFFVPKDIEEKEVVVNGKAYVTHMSVDEQRHFAEDAGKSPEEVEAIVEPEKTLSILAEGVIIERN